MNDRLKKLEQALRADKNLADQFTAQLKQIGEEQSAQNDAEAYAKAANALGFELTAADLEKAAAEAQQLDMEEVDSLSGGVGEEEWCLFDYACYATWKHPKHKDGDLEPCWSDYGCITVRHHCAYEANPPE